MADNYYEKDYEFQLPTYSSFVIDVGYALIKSWEQISWFDITPAGWIVSLTTHGSCSMSDLIFIVFFAALWTTSRSLLTINIFQKIARVSRLGVKEEQSLPECLWKFLFSLTAWIYSAYLVLFKYELFHNPVKSVIDWKTHSYVPWDVHIMYMFQISFYVHSIYATAVLDEWRKDSFVLLLHHCVTIMLLANSYLFRYIYIGLLILFLHDLSDIFLETTKLAVYYKSKGGRWTSACDALSSIGFVVFGVSWFIFRLYWFPLKAIYVSAHVGKEIVGNQVPPFFIFTNGLLLVLLLMHIYWFKFILQMAYKVLTGKTKQVDDVREYEKKHASNNRNGIRENCD